MAQGSEPVEGLSRADLPDDRWALDHGDDLHRAPAVRTQERVQIVHLLDEAGPGAVDLQGRPMVHAGDWVRSFGFGEEPVLPAVTMCLATSARRQSDPG
jgi:hypothetical protein